MAKILGDAQADRVSHPVIGKIELTVQIVVPPDHDKTVLQGFNYFFALVGVGAHQQLI